MLTVAVFSHKQTVCFHRQRFALAPHRYSKLKSRVNKASQLSGPRAEENIIMFGGTTLRSLPQGRTHNGRGTGASLLLTLVQVKVRSTSPRGRRCAGLTQDRHPESRRRSQQRQGQSPQLPKTGQPSATMAARSNAGAAAVAYDCLED